MLSRSKIGHLALNGGGNKIVCFKKLITGSYKKMCVDIVDEMLMFLFKLCYELFDLNS